MRGSIRLTLGALLALVALLLPARPAGAVPGPPPFDAIIETPLGGLTDGLHVAWLDQPGGNPQIFRLQAQSAGAGPLVLNASLSSAYYGGPFSPSYAISRGQVLWIASTTATALVDPTSKLMLTDIDSGQSRELAQGPLLYPGLDNDTATWWRVDDNWTMHLMRRNIRASEEPVEILTISGSYYHSSFEPKMSSHWQAWVQNDTTVGSQQCWSLYVAPLDSSAPSRRVGNAGCGYTAQFDLAGDTLAYVSSDGLLHVRDLVTGQDRTSGPHGSQAISTNGRYVFLLKDKALWGFDPRSDSAFPIYQGDDLSFQVHARGDALLWKQGDRLRVSYTSQLLPTSPRSPAAGRRHFPETNHTLGGEFLAYWSRNGGLPVFGYPLTEEFMQKNASDGKGYAVQYLERQRYELHPENAGTPYIVLLGRLGAEALAARGLDWQTLPKASPGAPHSYAQTGQAIDPLFWDYWRTHGLELGDPGVSEREALALWGYPLSGLLDERLPDGSTIKVQWYERARLEYHPENQPPYNVLLGRLAADTAEGLFK
jgi:hypothetical protein